MIEPPHAGGANEKLTVFLKTGVNCEKVFDQVKEVLSTLPVMQAPDWQKDFYVNRSVGEDAIAAMLLQKGKESQYMKPIYYASRVKTLSEKGFSEVELVMVSMVYACRRFRHYLLQKPFTFLTSYSLLPQLFNNSNVSKTVMRWIIELQEFQFTFLVQEYTCYFSRSSYLQKDTCFNQRRGDSEKEDGNS